MVSIILLLLGKDKEDKDKEDKDKDITPSEREERIKLEKAIDKEYLKQETHSLLCANAGLTVTKEITEHFDLKFKEHANDLKEAIKENGSKA